MDHAYIEEHNLIDLYGRGRLEPEEEIRFEEHFVGCSRCRQELEIAGAFDRGYRRMLAEDAEIRAATQLGILAWLTRFGRRTQMGLVMSLLLVVALLPTLWFGQRNARLQQTADEALAEVESWQQRQATAQQERDALARRLGDSERAWNVERERLAAQLEEAGTATPQPPSVPRTDEPWVNTPLFILGKMRSDGATNTIDLQRVEERLTLAVDVYADPRFAGYRVTITGSDGSVRWRRDELQPNALEVVMLTLPRDFLPPGSYRLELAGMLDSGEAVAVESFPFAIVG